MTTQKIKKIKKVVDKQEKKSYNNIRVKEEHREREVNKMTIYRVSYNQIKADWYRYVDKISERIEKHFVNKEEAEKCLAEVKAVKAEAKAKSRQGHDRNDPTTWESYITNIRFTEIKVQ